MNENLPDLIGEPPEPAKRLRNLYDPTANLTEEEVRFVACILRGNTRAVAYMEAIDPDYRGVHAGSLGSCVAHRPQVKRAIEEALAAAREEATSHATKNTARLLDEYLRLAYFDPAKLLDNTGRPLPLHEIDEDTRRAIVGLEVVDEFEGKGDQRRQIGTVKKYKLADKNRALDSLAKVLGLLVDKTEVTGKDGKDLVPEQVPNEELARRIAFVLLKAQKDGSNAT